MQTESKTTVINHGPGALSFRAEVTFYPGQPKVISSKLAAEMRSHHIVKAWIAEGRLEIKSGDDKQTKSGGGSK